MSEISEGHDGYGHLIALNLIRDRKVIGGAVYSRQTVSWLVTVAGRSFEEPTEHSARIALLAGKPSIETLGSAS